MAETQETVADIVAEMRNFAEHRDFDSDGNMSTTRLRVFASRIEAAARRAYNEIDHAVCAIEEAFSYDIDNVREAMEGTIGDYHE